VDKLQSEVKVNLGPRVNSFNGHNEKTHVGTWRVVEQNTSLMKMT